MRGWSVRSVCWALTAAEVLAAAADAGLPISRRHPGRDLRLLHSLIDLGLRLCLGCVCFRLGCVHRSTVSAGQLGSSSAEGTSRATRVLANMQPTTRSSSSRCTQISNNPGQANADGRARVRGECRGTSVAAWRGGYRASQRLPTTEQPAGFASQSRTGGGGDDDDDVDPCCSAIPLFRKHWDRGGAIEGVLVDLRIERFSVPQRRPKAKPPAAPRAFRRPQPAGGAASTTRGACGNKRPAGLSERCAVTAACHHHRAPRPDLVVSRASAARSLWCAAANGRGAGMARWG